MSDKRDGSDESAMSEVAVANVDGVSVDSASGGAIAVSEPAQKAPIFHRDVSEPPKAKRRGEDPELDAMMDELAKETGDPLYWDVKGKDRNAKPGVIIVGGVDMAKAHVAAMTPPMGAAADVKTPLAKKVLVAKGVDPRLMVTERRAPRSRVVQGTWSARWRWMTLAFAVVLLVLLSVRLGFYLAYKDSAGSLAPSGGEQSAISATAATGTATATDTATATAADTATATATATDTAPRAGTSASAAPEATATPAASASVATTNSTSPAIAKSRPVKPQSAVQAGQPAPSVTTEATAKPPASATASPAAAPTVDMLFKPNGQ